MTKIKNYSKRKFISLFDISIILILSGFFASFLFFTVPKFNCIPLVGAWKGCDEQIDTVLISAKSEFEKHNVINVSISKLIANYIIFRMERCDDNYFNCDGTFIIMENSLDGKIVAKTDFIFGRKHCKLGFASNIAPGTSKKYYPIAEFSDGKKYCAGDFFVKNLAANTRPLISYPKAGKLEATHDGYLIPKLLCWNYAIFQLKYYDADHDTAIVHNLLLRYKLNEWKKMKMIKGKGGFFNGFRYYLEYNFGENENYFADWEFKYEFNDGKSYAVEDKKITTNSIYRIPYLSNNQITHDTILANTKVGFSIIYTHQDYFMPTTRKFWIKPPEKNWQSVIMSPYKEKSHSDGLVYYTEFLVDCSGEWKYKYGFHGGRAKALGSGKIYSFIVLK